MVRQRSDDITPGHDELDIMAAMLNDKYVNHGLDKILKDVQIIRVEDPENYGEYPGIRIYGGQWIGANIAEEPNEDGTFVDVYQKSIMLEIYVMQNQEVKYAGEIFEGVCILTLIRDILVRIFSEQLDYPQRADEAVKAEITDLQIDYMNVESEYWVRDYLGQSDAVALLLSVVVSYEKLRL